MPSGYLAGFERAFIGLTDITTGATTGITSSLANGASSSPYMLSAVKTANVAPTPITDLEIQGGDAIRASISFGNQKLKQFQLIVSNYDTAVVSLVNGGTINTTNTQYTVGSENPMRQIPRQMFVALQQRYTLPNSTGQQYFTRIMPNCQVRLHEGGFAYQGESDTVLDVTPNPTNVDITGASFGVSGLNLGLQDNLTDNYFLISTNPIAFTAFRQDGTITSFTTPYAPTNTTVTLNATTNAFYVNGVATALTSITTAGVATLAAAGTAGVLDVLIYQTLSVPTT